MEFFTTQDLADKLHCNVRQIGKLRRNGLLKGIRAGHGYVFADSDVATFYERYAGCDLSSEEKMRFAKLLKNGCAKD